MQRRNIRTLDPETGNAGKVVVVSNDGSRMEFGPLNSGLTDEEVRDLIAGFLVQGTNISIVHNDTANTLTIASTGVDAEQVRDTVATFLVEGAGVTLVHDDTANTLTISAVLDAEVTRDTIAAALVEGPGITIDVDDAANTITISAAVTSHLVPLTTVINGEPALVWDSENNLVMTEVPA